jgi:hypothetical protein
MVARHFFCYCDWIGQPPDDYNIKKDIDVYNMYMPRLSEDEEGNFTEPFGDMILDKTKINVYLDSNEPDFYAPYPAPLILKKVPHFDVVLTRRPELLHFPNAKLFLFGTHWSNNYQTTFENKKDAVSYAMTNKKDRPEDLSKFGIQPADGYDVRHQIGTVFKALQAYCGLPLHGYNSQRYPTDYEGLEHTLSASPDGKLELMKYKFHLAVENSTLPNYMTEKLHDCFMTKTVPIYYGCPNVSDYYNMDGILKFDTAEELIKILKSLTPQKYDEMKDAIEDNHNRFLEIEGDGFASRFWKTIEEELKDVN